MFAPSIHHLRSILCIGCHADDIEVGCGGTILSLLAACPGLHVDWVVLSADGGRRNEAQTSARRFLAEASSSSVEIASFRDRYFPYDGEAIKDFYFQLRARCSPDLILTHRLEDRHQDHRTAAEFTWNTFRNHWILEYEIPKYEGDLGQPNVFVPITDECCRRKVEFTVESFASQRDKPWFTEDLLRATLRLRGVECQSPTGFAEGFYSRKMCLLNVTGR